jgi:hypothetical protein
MANLMFRHHNNCPLCPVIGAIPGEEYYELLALRFNIRIACELSRGHDLIRVEPIDLAKWLEHARILDSHVDHVPLNSGHGIMVTLPAGCWHAAHRWQSSCHARLAGAAAVLCGCTQPNGDA